MKRPVSVVRLRASGRAFRLIASLCVSAQVGTALPLQASERPAKELPRAPSAASPGVQARRNVPAVSSAPAYPVFSDAPTDAEITRARVFSEPLVPVGVPAAPRETLALSRAITTYLHTGTSEDVAPFLYFIGQYQSRRGAHRCKRTSGTCTAGTGT